MGKRGPRKRGSAPRPVVTFKNNWPTPKETKPFSQLLIKAASTKPKGGKT